MCFAQLGVKEVIATDMEPAFSCLQASIARNMGVLPPGKVRCEELRWGAESFTQLDALGQFDIVVCADLLYDSDLHVPLLETLLHVARDASTVIVISYEQRGSGAEGFFQGAEKGGLVASKVHGPDENLVEIHLLQRP
mmetsp:Transcript_73615/g.172921  ORF Transcript_73615/g.172921 Transcript_73615/m.172921 type:complete len:138 (+) Transcript_73615:344-757(+)